MKRIIYEFLLLVILISCMNCNNIYCKDYYIVPIKDKVFHPTNDTVINDTVVTYYENGNINKFYTVNKKGEKQGYYISYFTTGEIQSKIEFKNGKKHGEYIMFTKTGLILGYSISFNGKREYFLKRIGVKLFEESFYTNGIRDSARFTSVPVYISRILELEK